MKRTTMMVMMFAALASTACGCQSGEQTGGQTGTAAGGGIGEMAGQAAGGNTESTLVGDEVGSGVGYIIGDEADRKHAEALSAASTSGTPSHNEVGALGGTRWEVVSLTPKNAVAPYITKIVEFRRDGRVLTSTTEADESVITVNESYRVSGDTLIINKPGYLINARHTLNNDRLTVSAEQFSAVLRRLPN